MVAFLILFYLLDKYIKLWGLKIKRVTDFKEYTYICLLKKE